MCIKYWMNCLNGKLILFSSGEKSALDVRIVQPAAKRNYLESSDCKRAQKSKTAKGDFPVDNDKHWSSTSLAISGAQ